MKLTIHGGANHIGGSCVEIQSGDSRILLDFGMPLKDTLGLDFNERNMEEKSIETLINEDVLYNIEGLYHNSLPSVNAVFISHSHKDHYGFLPYINPEIPVYLSKGAYELIRALNVFLPESKGIYIDKPKFLQDRQKISVGGLSVTPYLVDHSGFNAMGFLVKEETTGKTILYTGDFRAGGWTRKRYYAFLKKPLEPIDYLLMEGTMIDREKGKYPDEKAVVQGIINAIQKSENTVIPVYCSGQNIDRIVSLYKAARIKKALLVVDPYTAYILRVVGEITGTTPEIEWNSIRAFIADYGNRDIYVNKISKSSRKEMIKTLGRKKINIYDFAHLRQKSLLLMRSTMIPVVEKIPQIHGSTLIYSMWKGYIEKNDLNAKKFWEFVGRNNLIVEHIHASGHATLEKLKEFARKVDAKYIVPIHTEHPEKFKKHFGNTVVRYNNGQCFDI
jgi:ribonuclease J